MKAGQENGETESELEDGRLAASSCIPWTRKWNSSLTLIPTGFSLDIADHHNGLTATVVLTHPSSRGSVPLTGAHPQDILDIQKNHFKGNEGKKNVIELRQAIKTTKRIPFRSFTRSTHSLPIDQYRHWLYSPRSTFTSCFLFLINVDTSAIPHVPPLPLLYLMNTVAAVVFQARSPVVLVLTGPWHVDPGSYVERLRFRISRSDGGDEGVKYSGCP